MAAGMPRQRLIESWYPDGELLTASPGRRLGGELLDAAIQFVCVFGGGLAAAAFPPALLLIFAWPVWFAFVARWGQTPGKQLLGMYVMRDDGSRAGGWYTVLRDFVIQGVLFGAIIGGITFGIGWAIAGVWCVWDRERRCLWDRIASTTVAWSPREFRPLTAADLERLGQRPPAFAPRRDAPSPPPPAPRDEAPPPPSAAPHRDEAPPAAAPGEPPAPRESGAAARLRELQRLRDEGLITAEQFEQRHDRIVEEL